MRECIKKNEYFQGFTIIEILVVVTIIIILAAIAIPYGSIFLAQNQLQDSTLNIIDSLRRTQSRAMSGMGEETWGIHFTNTSYTLFQGSSYDPVDPDNEVNDLSNVVRISSISLNGGGDDVIFNRVFGDTNNFGMIVLDDQNSDSQATISINEVGMIDYDYNL